MKVDGSNDAFAQGYELRQKTAGVDVSRATTEAGAKLDNARTSAVEDLKSAMTGQGGNSDREKELQDAVDKVNQYAEIQQVSLRLQVEKELQQVVVKVVDKDTDEVIRQIPSEQTIEIAKRLDEVMKEFLSGANAQSFSLFSDEV